MQQSADTTPQSGHLVVLVHGLWGTYKHVDTIAETLKHVLEGASDSKICLLEPKTSTYFKTYDGVEIMGNKFLLELLQEVKTLKEESNIKVVKFSIVGYSLGGLVSRYMIGKLYEIGFFNSVEPYFFTTFATPHLGVRFFNSPISSVLNGLGSIIGTSGKDLFMSSNMLENLTSGNYIAALKLFKQRYLLSNIRHDRTVSFYTSFITAYSPFENWDNVKLHFIHGVPDIEVNDVKVKPKILDLKRTTLRDPNDPPPKPTVKSRLRYAGVLVLIGFILPLWFPVVFTANCVGTIMSAFRTRMDNTIYDFESQWNSIKETIYGIVSEPTIVQDDDSSASSESPILKKRNSRESMISKELAEFTEGAIENMLEATKRNEDLDRERSKSPSSSKTEQEEDDSNSKISVGGLQSAIKLDLNEYSNKVSKLLPQFDNKLNTEDLFPLFNHEEIERLPFDDKRNHATEVMNELQWYKIPVYIDVFNAHDGIVARRGLRSSFRGLAVIYLWAGLIRSQTVELEGSTKK